MKVGGREEGGRSGSEGDEGRRKGRERVWE